MNSLVPLLFAGVVGFTHAFEIDHLLAVSSIVTRRKSVLLAVKDGVFWGLGHTSTILLIGMVMILAQVAVSERAFHFFEAGVGVMLTLLGLQRIRDIYLQKQKHAHAHEHDMPHNHKLAYGVGLVHGLAGSGTLVLLVMTQLKNGWESMTYLLIFGLGSVLGMLLASGVFFMPFSRKWTRNFTLQRGLTVVSSLLCITFGCKVVFDNLNNI
jgi:high-affinity nickel permease